MAFDLTDEELQATREMNGASKKVMNNEDKKILEEYVQEFNENKKKYKLAYSTGFGKFWSNFVKAIENLINRNKQLEEIEKEHQKENGELRNKLTEYEQCLELTSKYLDNIAYDQIPIAIGELRERIKELEKYENYYKNERMQLIPKSKIKEKIEELDRELQLCEKQHIDTIKAYTPIDIIKAEIKRLQELLQEGDK